MDSMSDEHLAVLRECHVRLCSDLDVSHPMDVLYQAKIFSEDDMQRVDRETTDMDKRRKFLSILKRKKDQAHGKFVGSLLESQTHLAVDLQTSLERIKEDTQKNKNVINEDIANHIKDCLKGIIRSPYEGGLIPMETIRQFLEKKMQSQPQHMPLTPGLIINMMTETFPLSSIEDCSQGTEATTIFTNVHLAWNDPSEDNIVADKLVNTDEETIEEHALTKDMKTWTQEDVCSWLKSLHLNISDLFDVIMDQKIDGEVLATMTTEDFKEVFTDIKFGERKKIINGRDKLKDKSPPNVTEQSCITETSKAATSNPVGLSQMLRKFDQDISTSFTYDRGAIADNVDKDSSDLIRPIRNFVSINLRTKLTSHRFDFRDRTIKFICACLNDRTNGTIHFGISSETDDQHKAYEIVGTSLAENKKYYGEYMRRAINECFFPEQRNVVQSCTRTPKFIEVISSDSISDLPKFVIEIDVIPSSTLCKDDMFDIHFQKEEEAGKQTKSFEKIEVFRFSEDRVAKVVEGLPLREFKQFKLQLYINRRDQEGLTISAPRVPINLKRKLTHLLCGAEQQFYPDQVFPLLLINSPAEHMNEDFLRHNLNFLSRLEFKAIFYFDSKASLLAFFEDKQDGRSRVITTSDYFDQTSTKNCGNPNKLKTLHEDLNTSVQIPWIFVNGYITEEKSLLPPEWKKTKREGLQCAVRFFKEEIPAHRAVVVFCLLSKDWEVMLEAAEEFLLSFTGQWICIVEDEYIAGPWIKELKRRHCINDTNVRENMIIGLPWIHVCETIISLTRSPDRTTCLIPNSSQGVSEVEKHVRNSLYDLEIVGSNACDITELDDNDIEKKSEETKTQFYHGAEVDWWNFAFETHVCRRQKMDDLKSRVRESLLHKAVDEENVVGRVTLYHQAGAGGSTLARHVMWDFRKEYRCAVVQTLTDVQVTADQISQFRSYKENNEEANPVLLLLDNHNEEKTTKLWTTLEREAKQIMQEKNKHAMCVLLICLRRSDCDTSGTTFLRQNLTPVEKHWFKTNPIKSDIDPAYLISFNIMKENFDKEIISKTVTHFVSSIDDEKELLLLKYMSLINTYDLDFCSIPTSAFDCFMTTRKVSKKHILFSTSMKMGTAEKYKIWENNVSDTFYTLMNKIRRVGMGYIGSLRMTNKFLAACVLEILQNRKQHKQILSEVAMELIQCKDIFGPETGKPCCKLVEIMTNMLKRRERSVSGRQEQQFAPLVQDIIKNETIEKAKLLLKTFEKSENDPFISQQIARLCMKNEEWDEANEYAEKAISQKPDDSYLWDTYGRASLEQMSSMYIMYKQRNLSDEDLKIIVKLAFCSIDKFKRAQEFGYSTYVNNAGFLGQLEAILKLLECLCIMHLFSDRKKLHLFLVTRDYIPAELQFLEDIDGVDFLVKFKQLQIDVELVLSQLEDEKVQLREDALDEYRKGQNIISHDKLIRLKSSLGSYFGEHDTCIPLNLNLEDACSYRRRYISYTAGNTLTEILNLRFSNGGEKMLNSILEISQMNIDAKCGNEQDFKHNLSARFALMFMSGEYAKKMKYSTVVDYSRQLYSLRNQSKNHRFVSLEPYLFYAMLNWPGRKTTDKCIPPPDFPKVMQEWKEVYLRKYDKQRCEGKPKFFFAKGRDFQSFVSYEDLKTDMKTTPAALKYEFRTNLHVLGKLKRFTGTLLEGGCEVRVKHEDSSQTSNIIIPTSFSIRQKDRWNKNVFFVIGFSWRGPQAHAIDPDNLTASDDHTTSERRPFENVDQTSDSEQSHTHSKATSRANTEAHSHFGKKKKWTSPKKRR